MRTGEVFSFTIPSAMRFREVTASPSANLSCAAAICDSWSNCDSWLELWPLVFAPGISPWLVGGVKTLSDSADKLESCEGTEGIGRWAADGGSCEDAGGAIGVLVVWGASNTWEAWWAWAAEWECWC